MDGRETLDPVAQSEESCWSSPAVDSLSDYYTYAPLLADFGWNFHSPAEEFERNAMDRTVVPEFCSAADDVPEISGCSGMMMQSGRSSPDLVKVAGTETTMSNHSASSSSLEDQPEKSTGSGGDAGGIKPPAEAPVKVKKKGQKRIRQPRFAFMTKSEVDHLEDGYRWRKYGQKAVKNSPFPRSYFRCTNSKCTVKKRVERSCEDPTTVITTYEGQHSHHSAGLPRGRFTNYEAAFSSQFVPPASPFFRPAMQLLSPREGSYSMTPSPCYDLQPPHEPVAAPDQSTVQPNADGLLGDIISPRMRNASDQF